MWLHHSLHYLWCIISEIFQNAQFHSGPWEASFRHWIILDEILSETFTSSTSKESNYDTTSQIQTSPKTHPEAKIHLSWVFTTKNLSSFAGRQRRNDSFSAALLADYLRQGSGNVQWLAREGGDWPKIDGSYQCWLWVDTSQVCHCQELKTAELGEMHFSFFLSP